MRLQAGDYIVLNGIKESEYLAVRQAFAEAGCSFSKTCTTHYGKKYAGWCRRHNGFRHYNNWDASFTRKLTIEEVLNSTTSMKMTPIKTRLPEVFLLGDFHIGMGHKAMTYRKKKKKVEHIYDINLSSRNQLDLNRVLTEDMGPDNKVCIVELSVSKMIEEDLVEEGKVVGIKYVKKTTVQPYVLIHDSLWKKIIAIDSDHAFNTFNVIMTATAGVAIQLTDRKAISKTIEVIKYYAYEPWPDRNKEETVKASVSRVNL